MAGAATQPLVLELEDAQWADPSTLELIGKVIERDAQVPLLVLITARPEFAAPWPGSKYEQLALPPLNEGEARKIVTGMVAASNLPNETIAVVVQRSGGVPLFLEEVTRLLIEGHGDVGAHEIPPTLHASLLARLDRLGAVKEIAQMCAVIGREFDWSLLSAVVGTDNDTLASALIRLNDAEMIHCLGQPPQASYRFNHALFQDAAYDSLLKSRRRELHHAIARTLNKSFSDVAQARPEILAYHFTEAGENETAISLWQRAGPVLLGVQGLCGNRNTGGIRRSARDRRDPRRCANARHRALRPDRGVNSAGGV
ncbi:MAG: hypothetical protein EXR86_15605 [Gammaproteobacteria bacterium]|nr:hypothetical protein [Gammaproteobacteria bacterium]